ncbi:MAG: STAS domain-containing protein [Alphaproteobacteria bacterium]|uniref:STAS domain-containing protein n=1 Tax=Candidatus Nitrobium versatile TaxID=2884831 RepID=A0A953J7G0_9BACT|nr:STAS domain-containing protein [Candidatus Nitrobium versatile]
MRFAFEQCGDIGLLTCHGELTTQHTGELKAALMKALDSVDHLIFNLEKVTVIDTACFQLLCMAHRISRSLNKRITFTGIRHKPFKRLFEDTGPFRRKECVVDCLKAVCRWVSGERLPGNTGKGDESRFARKWRREGNRSTEELKPAGAQ